MPGAGLISSARRRNAASGPDFANVYLLFGFNGADGSTTFTDESSFGRNGTAVGNAQIDTAVSKFGTGSLLLDGSGDAVSLPQYAMHAGTSVDNSIETTDDVQIEAWIRFASVATNQEIVSQYNATFNHRAFRFRFGSAGILEFDYYADGSTLSVAASASWSPSTLTWYHVAYTRVGGISRIFVDGAKLAQSAVNNFADSGIGENIRFGGLESGGSIVNSFNGWMDEIRVAKYASNGSGTKFYTADFTPPAAAFPRS